jgi:hypothetical protein
MKVRLVLGLGLLAGAIPMFAHHSFSAEFDSTKKITLKGAIVKVEWMNPHIWVYVDVKDDAGSVAHWQCEGGPPNTLSRNGWTKNTLKQGDQVTISGTLAKDATNTCNASSVSLPDGRRVFAGSSNPDANPDTAKQDSAKQ